MVEQSIERRRPVSAAYKLRIKIQHLLPRPRVHKLEALSTHHGERKKEENRTKKCHNFLANFELNNLHPNFRMNRDQKSQEEEKLEIPRRPSVAAASVRVLVMYVDLCGLLHDGGGGPRHLHRRSFGDPAGGHRVEESEVGNGINIRVLGSTSSAIWFFFYGQCKIS